MFNRDKQIFNIADGGAISADVKNLIGTERIGTVEGASDNPTTSYLDCRN